ncbi:hypothetical protein IIY24_00815 [Candidatus Saccharibacteria bacterium]|nr:hypothetical protein [Candidatus Saccharibacteria bacterium]
MAILNLTPHTINLIAENGETVMVIPPSGVVARATQTDQVCGEVEGIEVVKTSFGAPTDLPEPCEGVYLVVSLATANAARTTGRSTDDLLLTSSPVRDEGGRIIGCRRFARI